MTDPSAIHLAMCLDRAYLARGVAAYRSLVEHCGPFVLWVLCLDPATLTALRRLALPHVRPVAESEVLDDRLEAVRASRSRREYVFATKPWLLGHVLRTSTAHRVTHLDGDVRFFSDPTPVLTATADRSVVLTPHRSGDERFERRFGTFNAGWVTVAGDARGRAALAWWRDRCAEATPDYPVDGRFGEQKYLDELPVRFAGVAVADEPGLNLAPWNLAGSAPVRRAPQGGVLVGDQPLVMYHSHGFERWSRTVYVEPPYSRRAQPDLRTLVHLPYARGWHEAEALLGATLGDTAPPPSPWGSTRARPWWWRSARLVARRSAAVAGRRLLVLG